MTFKTILNDPGEPVSVTSRMIQLIPVQMYILPTGTKDNKASVAVVMATGDGTPVVIGQISLRMIFESLDESSKALLSSEIYSLKIEERHRHDRCKYCGCKSCGCPL